MLPEPESLPRFTAVRIIVVSTTHERIIELLVQGSRATREVIHDSRRIKRRTYLANHVNHDLLLRCRRLMSNSQRHRGIAAATWIDEAGINEACHWQHFVEIAHASLDNLRRNETFNVRTELREIHGMSAGRIRRNVYVDETSWN